MDRKIGKRAMPHGRKARKVHRAWGILLSAVMVFNMLPTGGISVFASGEKAGLCGQYEEQERTGGKAVTAWDWIDPEEHLTDGMLALPGAGRENPALMEDVTALLPEKIQAKAAAGNVAENGEETEEDAETAPETEDAEITLTGWECASYPKDGAYEGAYTFTASLPEGFVLTEDAAALEVKVELGGAGMLAETVSASYRKATWNGSEVTYSTQTAENCTVVENSTEAVTWNAGWYVVNSTVTISEPVTITGEVHLILADGCALTAAKGIVVTKAETANNSLTVYAQSEGNSTGTLTATGTKDSNNNASAGIGGSTGSHDSGSITIHGGVINATGGVANDNYGNPACGGAGIGGGTSSSENGGNSGTITIYGGTITANSGARGVTGAGIGGGGGGYDKNGGSGSGITIYGGNVTAASHGTQSGGAGIGGGAGNIGNGGAGNNIQIYGGMVHATGGYLGAGIGGGGAGATSGSGNVTIAGGKVTAVGGECAAGIGGGGGYQGTFGGGPTGGTGNVSITGGIVDAKGGAGNYEGNYAGAPIGNGGNTTVEATVNKTTGIVFENKVGTVCGSVVLNENYAVPADYSLHIPAGASLSGSGTLSGGGTFTTENLTADMITVPAGLYYNGQDRTEYLKTELARGVKFCGRTFAAKGWTLTVAKTDDWNYTAVYTNDSDYTKNVQKTITLLKDTAAPAGEISIGTDKWNSFLHTITFGLFFKKTEQITITAQDNESGVASVSYYISDRELTEEEVKAMDHWTAGNKDKTTFSISPDKSCVVYAKITDYQGNASYISSNGLVFDGTPPAVAGVTDGKTYCTPQTVAVTDDNLASVTVNGNKQALSGGSFTLDMEPGVKTMVIEAADKAGNITAVTVNAGHDYGTDWKSDRNGHWQECAVCGGASDVSAHTEDSGTVTKPATDTVRWSSFFVTLTRKSFIRNYICVLFSNGVIYPFEECGRI